MADADPAAQRGRTRFVIAFLLLVVASLSVFFFRLNYMEATRAMRWRSRTTRSLADRRDGPGIFHGVLDGPSDRVTPAGLPAIAWIAWSSVDVGSGRNRQTEYCERHEISGLTLRDGTVTLPIDVRGVNDVMVAESGSDALLPGDFALAFDGDQRDAPGDWGTNCSITVRPAAIEERRASAGEAATFIGCRRGDRLVLCRDDLDAISTLGVAQPLSAWRGTRIVTRVGAMLVGFMLGMLGLQLLEGLLPPFERRRGREGSP